MWFNILCTILAVNCFFLDDGSIETLEEVIDYYDDEGGDHNIYIDTAIFPLHFTNQEKVDLLEFLKALSSSFVDSRHP